MFIELKIINENNSDIYCIYEKCKVFLACMWRRLRQESCGAYIQIPAFPALPASTRTPAHEWHTYVFVIDIPGCALDAFIKEVDSSVFSPPLEPLVMTAVDTTHTQGKAMGQHRSFVFHHRQPSYCSDDL